MDDTVIFSAPFNPEETADALDCQTAAEVHLILVEHMRHRAKLAADAAKELRETSRKALCEASSYEREAANFEQLAGLIERAPVFFWEQP